MEEAGRAVLARTWSRHRPQILAPLGISTLGQSWMKCDPVKISRFRARDWYEARASASCILSVHLII